VIYAGITSAGYILLLIIKIQNTMGIDPQLI
jgi:hypothetical protein